MKIILNIGLNSNPFTWLELSRRLGFNTHGILVSETKKVIGSYLNNEEATLVVKADCTMNDSELNSFIELLCMALNQECIAVKIQVPSASNTINKVIYSPTFKGERMEFNEKLFLE